jgi:hypothetical protein
MQVTTPQAAGAVVKQLMFRVVMRNFPTAPNNIEDKATMVFCPRDDIVAATANCPNTRNFRDIVREFTIDLNNNTGMTPLEFNDFALGRIYFFR